MVIFLIVLSPILQIKDSTSTSFLREKQLTTQHTNSIPSYAEPYEGLASGH